MRRQDLNGVRTPQDLERKYDFSSIGELKKNFELQKEVLTKVENELTDFVKATTKNLEDIQDQVDGNITTWFSSGVPDLDNYPANEWSIEEEKNNHLGDLYYDKDTGYAYRFTLENETYYWLKITDNDVTEALALANSAKDTADKKRQVFIEQPIPPYDVGDLWIKNEELYRCQTSRPNGETYEDNDWIIATKYTDDTIANQVGKNLTILSGTVTEIKQDVDELSNTMTNTTELVNEQGEKIGTLETKTSETSQTVDEIKTEVNKKVGEEEIASVISQTADRIFIESNNFGWKSKNSNMDVDGKITTTGGLIGGWEIGTEELYNFLENKDGLTQEDLDKMYAYTKETTTLTEDEIEKYDLNNDGEVDIADIAYLYQLLSYGITKDTPGKVILKGKSLLENFAIIDGNGNKLTTISLGGITTNRLIIDGNDFNEYIKTSFCKMNTNVIQYINTTETQITAWGDAISKGDYLADVENGRLIIKNTSIVRLTGSIAGKGYAWAGYGIYEVDGTPVTVARPYILYQFEGNGYWQAPLQTVDVELEPTKEYYVILNAHAYNNEEFAMNNGFSNNATWISALKIM